jgi:hypothetical protein
MLCSFVFNHSRHFSLILPWQGATALEVDRRICGSLFILPLLAGAGQMILHADLQLYICDGACSLASLIIERIVFKIARQRREYDHFASTAGALAFLADFRRQRQHAT